MPELHQLLSQALEKRGQHLKQTWRGKGGVKYTLKVICHLKGGDPQWILLSDKSGPEPLVDYTSCDVLLVSKILVNAVNQPSQQNSISFKKPEISSVPKRSGDKPSPTLGKSNAQEEMKKAATKEIESTRELSELKIDFTKKV